MTLRKQLIWVILMTVIFAIGLSTLISSLYMDTFFRNYVQNQYDQRIAKIQDLVLTHMSEYGNLESLSPSELGQLMEDPIIGIQIIDLNQRNLLSVSAKIEEGHSPMMRGKRFKDNTELLMDQYALKIGDQLVGSLLVTRNSSLQSTESVMLFKSALRFGAMISAFIALIMASLLTSFLSQRLSVDLKRVARFASELQTIDLKRDANEVKGLSKLSSTAEISAIELSLNDLYSKLRLQQDLQRRQADQLSHEARTPLTLLQTQLEGALDGVIVMDFSRLESCLHEVETLTRTLGSINQVLSVTEEVIVVNKSQFDLCIELRKIAKGMRLQFEQKNVAFHLNLPAELMVTSDKIILSQVVYNLLTNAYKFTPPQGEVTLSARPLLDGNAQQSVEILVEDTGIGVNDESIEDLFKPYYRAPAARHIQGEGLGLYIAQQNIQALDGTLILKQNSPQGTIAKVTV